MNAFRYSVIAVCIGLLLCSCRGAQDETVQTSAGIQVTARAETETAPLATALDAHTWTFRVKTPSDGANYACAMEVRQKGKQPVSWGDVAVDRDGDVTIVVLPEGISLNDSAQLRCARITGSGSGLSKFANPFRHDDSITIHRVKHLGDGVFALLSTSNVTANSVPSEDSVQLVCRFIRVEIP